MPAECKSPSKIHDEVDAGEKHGDPTKSPVNNAILFHCRYEDHRRRHQRPDYDVVEAE